MLLENRTVVGGLPIDQILQLGNSELPTFPPDEGPIGMKDLALSDPFVPLWPRILPIILDLYEAISGIWLPASQATLSWKQGHVLCAGHI